MSPKKIRCWFQLEPRTCAVKTSATFTSPEPRYALIINDAYARGFVNATITDRTLGPDMHRKLTTSNWVLSLLAVHRGSHSSEKSDRPQPVGAKAQEALPLGPRPGLPFPPLATSLCASVLLLPFPFQ